MPQRVKERERARETNENENKNEDKEMLHIRPVGYACLIFKINWLSCFFHELFILFACCCCLISLIISLPETKNELQ